MTDIQEQAQRITSLASRIANNLRLGAIVQSVLPGLTTSQLQILALIDESGREEMSMTEMAKELDVSTPTVTGLVDQLVHRALAARRHGEADRRKVLVSLTEAGQAALDDVRETMVDLFSRLLEEMSEEDRALLVTATERVSALSLKIRDEETASFRNRWRRQIA